MGFSPSLVSIWSEGVKAAQDDDPYRGLYPPGIRDEEHLAASSKSDSTYLKAAFACVHEPPEVRVAESCSQLWRAPTDNMLEIEMSHSDMDEDAFADIISSPALQRGRGERG